MTLPAPTAVAFAISGGSPVDVREWITVDLPGPPSIHRRGFAVMTESLERSGRSDELARHARELILRELRAHPRRPADAALARAFAITNTLVFEEGRFRGGVGQEFFVGATAVVFEDHKATIAYVPPGQVILAQDGVVYSVPELESRLPHWAEAPDDTPMPEPFGYASWTAPLMVQTEIMSGDTLVLCNAAVAEALAAEGTDLGDDRVTIRRFHARDPDRVLDTIRDVALERSDTFATVAVIGFPPDPSGAEIATLSDIGRNAREQWRHAKAAVRSVVPMPARRRIPVAPLATSGDSAESDEEVLTIRAQPQHRRRSFQERLARFTEGDPEEERALWRQPSEVRQLGAPGAHGVSRYRTVSTGTGEASWRHALPRLPFLTSRTFILFCILVVVAAGAFAWNERDRFLPSEEDYLAELAEVDQRLLAVADSNDEDVIRRELAQAEEELEEARRAGAPDDLLDPREAQITLEWDEINNVIRMDDVTRVGGLPAELQFSGTRVFNTPGGLYLANGDLYRLRVETAEMQLILQQGDEVEGLEVGHLFGVVWDGDLLMTTDGSHLFFGDLDGTNWQSMVMEEINEQGPWPAGPVSAFGESLYLLVDDYRNIYQFPTDPEQESVAPRDWVLTGDRVNLDMAVDLTIDGNIYVLLSNGQVLTMNRGAEMARMDVPGIDLESEEPLAIVGGPMTGYIYIAIVDNEGHGRVIAMDREGGHVSQLALPINFSTGDADVLPPFDDLQDIAVDEESGMIYLINGDAVWTARYSLPPLPGAEGTPEATATPQE